MKSNIDCALAPIYVFLTFAAFSVDAEADLAKIAGVSADPARPGFTFNSEEALKVTDPVRIPREVSSVCAFTVCDGPGAVDLAFEGGILETGGACGFVKDGPGTLKIAGEVRISGFITVYEGVLDLSAARIPDDLRVHLMGKARLVPPPGNRRIDLHQNGERLAPGVWGPLPSTAYGLRCSTSGATICRWSRLEDSMGSAGFSAAAGRLSWGLGTVPYGAKRIRRMCTSAASSLF
jgi:autotransporter-associated beta strand protein